MSFDTARTVVACAVGFAIFVSLAGATTAAALMLLFDARAAAARHESPTTPNRSGSPAR